MKNNTTLNERSYGSGPEYDPEHEHDMIAQSKVQDAERKKGEKLTSAERKHHEDKAYHDIGYRDGQGRRLEKEAGRKLSYEEMMAAKEKSKKKEESFDFERWRSARINGNPVVLENREIVDLMRLGKMDEGSMGMKRLLRKSKGIQKAERRLGALNRNEPGPSIPHDVGDAARNILKSRAGKARDQIDKKRSSRRKRVDTRGAEAAIGKTGKVRKKALKAITHAQRQDTQVNNLSTAGTRMAAIAQGKGGSNVTKASGRSSTETPYVRLKYKADIAKRDLKFR